MSIEATAEYVASVSVQIPAEWRVPVAFVVFVIGTLIYGITQDVHRNWHSVLPFAVAVLLVLLGFLLRRSRVAWWTFVFFGVAGVITWLSRLPADAYGGVLGLAELALLLSPQMRRFIGFSGRLAPEHR
jgi:hypothetical protein